MTRNPHHWVIVLAGGAPRADVDAEGTLLERALDRAGRLVDPAHVVTLVTAGRSAAWRDDAEGRRSGLWVVQDQDRGSAAAVLLPLVEVVRRDPAATVTLLPADHDALDHDALNAATQAIARASQRHGGAVVLLGVAPESPGPGYAYILPSSDHERPVQDVVRFVSRPSATAARALVRRNALWCSFILSAGVSKLLDLFATHQPGLLLGILGAASRPLGHGHVVQVASRHLGVRDFGGAVLAPSVNRLRVRRAPYCGWRDLSQTPAPFEDRPGPRGGEKARLAAWA